MGVTKDQQTWILWEAGPSFAERLWRAEVVKKKQVTSNVNDGNTVVWPPVATSGDTVTNRINIGYSAHSTGDKAATIRGNNPEL